MAAGEPTVLLLTDPALDTHAWPGHPERPERRVAAAAGVTDGARNAGARLIERSAVPLSIEEVAVVHHRGYLDWLVARAAEGGTWVDADTFVVEASVSAARLAAGLAVAAAAAVAAGEADVAFAVIRPPGHHAFAEQGKGFCLLNNVALATRALRASGAATRVAILDWDVHHGDGTQAIFLDDAAVFYASTHQFPWYPGSGSEAERTATTLNAPLTAGTGDEGLQAAWQEVILPAVVAWKPDAVLVSAGYDAHRDDPLAALEVTDAGFRAVSSAIGAAAAGLGLPGIALVLEGGYDLPALRASTAATVEGLLEGLGRAARRDSGT